MEETINEIALFWFKKEGAQADGIRHVETTLGYELPGDYKTFLLWSNGGEGEHGDNYLSLWEIESIFSLNKEYQIDKYIPKILGVGTDGGSQCYGFDYREDPHNPRFIQFPLGDIAFSSLVYIGQSFREGLRILFGLD